MSGPPFNYANYLRSELGKEQPNQDAILIKILVPSRSTVERGLVNIDQWPQLAAAYAALPEGSPSTPSRMASTFFRALADLIDQLQSNEKQTQLKDDQSQNHQNPAQHGELQTRDESNTQQMSHITPEMLDQLDRMSMSGSPVHGDQKTNVLEQALNPSRKSSSNSARHQPTQAVPHSLPGLSSSIYNTSHAKQSSFTARSPSSSASVVTVRSASASDLDLSSHSPIQPGAASPMISSGTFQHVEPVLPLWSNSTPATAHQPPPTSMPYSDPVMGQGPGRFTRPTGINSPFSDQSRVSGFSTKTTNGPRAVSLGSGYGNGARAGNLGSTQGNANRSVSLGTLPGSTNRAMGYGIVDGRRPMGRRPLDPATGSINTNTNTNTNTNANANTNSSNSSSIHNLMDFDEGMSPHSFR